MAEIAAVPVIVLSRHEDRAEALNSALRNKGQPARVMRLDDAGDLAEQLAQGHWRLVVVFADESDGLLGTAGAVVAGAGRDIPLVSVREMLDEDIIAADMALGADDCVTLAQRERLAGVLDRELKLGRLERALKDALNTAAQYREQLRRVVAGTADALSHVAEGIVLDANHAWAQLFGFEDEASLSGFTFMDLFAPEHQPAIKGALVACSQGRWPGQALKATGEARDGTPVSMELEFEAANFDGEACVRVRVPARRDDGHELEDKLRGALQLDQGTGLYGRRHFLEQLDERLKAELPAGVQALVVFAVDQYDKLERQVGTRAADVVVAGLADLLRDVVQARDLYGRVGASLFAAFVARGNRRDLKAWVQSVGQKVARTLFEAGGKSVSISLSAGIAIAEHKGQELDLLYGEAQEALSRAVDMGGGQVGMSRHHEDSTRIEEMDQLWVKRIKKALIENRFRLAHQPIASLSGEEKDLFDLLVRMVDEQGDELLPNQFMPAAERNRLVKNIDRWVIGAAFAFCASRNSAKAFVRLSRDTMLDTMLPAWLETRIKNTNTDPTRIVFQVTEAAAASHLKQTRDMALRLKKTGFGFSVEGFAGGPGTGQIIGHLPMDYLKIDGSLMQGLAADTKLQERVGAIVKEARGRNVRTIAERVEDANTMAVLWQLGVQYIQGYQIREPEVVLSAGAD